MALVATKRDDVDAERVSFFFSCRFFLAVIGFFVFLHLYAQRIGMSVAIVCMVNQTALSEVETKQTVNGTQVAWSSHSGTEQSVNETNQSSHCSHLLGDGAGFLEVIGILLFSCNRKKLKNNFFSGLKFIIKNIPVLQFCHISVHSNSDGKPYMFVS